MRMLLYGLAAIVFAVCGTNAFAGSIAAGEPPYPIIRQQTVAPSMSIMTEGRAAYIEHGRSHHRAQPRELRPVKSDELPRGG